MSQRYDDDNFEEDGGTFDFDDEPVSSTRGIGSRGMIYPEYHGEDFSQYLNDDDEHTGVYPWDNSWQTERPDDSTSSKRRRPKSTAIIREKLGRLLLSSGSARSRNSVPVAPQSLSRIQDVSFADCKMGGILVEPPGAAGSDSGIDCRSGFSLETESDLSAQASSGWWDMDNRRRQEEARSSASALNLYDHRLNDHFRSGPEVVQGQRNVVEQDRSTSDGSKRLSNPFRKIYNTLNRRKSANLQQMSHSQDYDDIRL